MKTLCVFDKHNYTDDMKVFNRFAVRGIIIRDGRIAMQQSSEGYYKILGGGIDEGETHSKALEREIREESGLVIIPESIRECGETIEKRRDIFDGDVIYCCHTYVYFCDAQKDQVETDMTDSEILLGYHLAWARPDEIIEANSKFLDMEWIARDTKIIELISWSEMTNTSISGGIKSVSVKNALD